MKKVVLIPLIIFIVLVCAGSFTGIIIWVVSLSAPLSISAENFLLKIGNGNLKEAYETTTSKFQTDHSEAEFFRWVKAKQLHQFDSLSWNHRSFNNNQGIVKGIFITKRGEEIPIELQFEYEGEEWRVNGLKIQGEDFAPSKPVEK